MNLQNEIKFVGKFFLPFFNDENDAVDAVDDVTDDLFNFDGKMKDEICLNWFWLWHLLSRHFINKLKWQTWIV